MTERTKATSITPQTRQEVMERDRGCVSCGNNHNLTVAHIWINRSHGGRGVKENLAVLCLKCHHELDNGRKAEQEYQQAVVQQYMMGLYGKPDLNKLKYQKYDSIF